MKQYRLSAALLAALTLAACGNDEPKLEPEPLPYDFSVLEYTPAPGQFVNEIPEYNPGDTRGIMVTRADVMLHNREMISLGAWGGSIVLALNQPLINYDGADFRLLGNAYVSTTGADGRRAGSSEPGIVYVMSDTNKNGVPDDTWYELRGEDYGTPRYNYEVTYHRPADDATDEKYIRWTASDGTEGYLNRVASYHAQNFFAEWVGEGDQTFRGCRLPDNSYIDEAGVYRLINLRGYADASPNNDDGSALDISSAIDAQGNSVSLLSIDFIKVVTGVLQTNGILGECSTEISGMEFLH